MTRFFRRPRAVAAVCTFVTVAAGCARETGESDSAAAVAAEPAPVAPRPVVTEIAGPAGVLHIDDGGSGDSTPVVFVHAFTGNTEQWRAQLDHVRGTRRAVAIDLRGHGQSAKPALNDYSIEALASDIAAVVDSLGLQRFVLVGHSLGGAAAAAYAGTHPDRLAGLVLVTTPGRLPADQVEKVTTSLETDYDKTNEEFWSRLTTGATPSVKVQVLRDRETVLKDAAMALVKATFAFDPVPPLRNYTGPKLSIGTSPRETPTELHNQVPGIPYKQFAGTSHWPQMDKPTEFNEVLDEFLMTYRCDRTCAVGSAN